jgi:hypothetical protein
MLGHAAVGREQSKLPVSLIVCVQRFDYTTHIRVLAVIDFAEIQHWPLRVLVTGGPDYVGSHTCKCLTAAGYNPVVVDNLSTGHR